MLEFFQKIYILNFFFQDGAQLSDILSYLGAESGHNWTNTAINILQTTTILCAGNILYLNGVLIPV